MENVSTYLEVTDEDFLEDGNMLYPFFFLCLAIYEAKLMIKGWCALSISLLQVPVWLKHYYSELIGLVMTSQSICCICVALELYSRWFLLIALSSCRDLTG
ncbi:hypothetical protein PVAP13_4NG263811 [Panicum virgatum]|uniref:Uncharacterized protein n=1 Tax=Panicum virgatum TaxID=38727 RepID=A0A8T0TG85_PANVG|nr:hypothetical protein PVAP13_4NG263811 [Panicum virgatum]